MCFEMFAHRAFLGLGDAPVEHDNHGRTYGKRFSCVKLRDARYTDRVRKLIVQYVKDLTAGRLASGFEHSYRVYHLAREIGEERAV